MVFRSQGVEGVVRDQSFPALQVVEKHISDLRADERLIQKRQDKAAGKSLNGKSFF